MEPDVVEIAPPLASSSRTRTKKQVVIPEVIDVERYEIQNGGGSVLSKSVNKKNKGKAVKGSSYSYDDQTKDTATDAFGPLTNIESHPAMSPGSQNMLGPDYLNYGDEDEYCDHYLDEAMDVDDYCMYEDFFDFKDIPTDVEAPIPFFQNSTYQEAAKSSGSSSSHGNNGNKLGAAGSSKKKTRASASSSLPSWPQMSSSSTSQPLNNVSNSGGSTSLASNLPHHPKVIFPSPNPISKSWNPFSKVISGIGGFTYSSAKALPMVPHQTFDMVMGAHPSGVGLPVSPAPHNSHASYSSRRRKEESILAKDSSRVQKNVEDFLGKFLFFKRFDIVEDFSDHHYASRGCSSKQHAKSWAKRIQEEWKILEKDLPDMIFVRAYESRMDLLRAVIIGAEGTPYHDGLFFFDIYFPTSYPNTPPQVHYHSGGLRINPNLYDCGKVCLSLLGTWSGNHREKWIPDVSTMLQVLVSIQALILNQNPYFNEPGYEGSRGTQFGEASSKKYSENTFILSLRTMVYNMRRPPKHFEDFACGHFFSRAHDILKACKAYKGGAPVGSLVKGGVQDVEESSSSSSKRFRDEVDSFMKVLVIEFAFLGVQDMDKATGNNNNNNNNGDDSAETNKVKTKRDRGST